MKVFTKKNMCTIKRFIFGGEGYPIPKLKELYNLYGNRAIFYNVYGPTESTCICSSHVITENDLEGVNALAPLGIIAKNFDYMLLDEDREVKDNESGELCLMGPCVGKGYYREPKLTEASFVQNPKQNDYYEIIYKTADLVRLDPIDNYLHFIGRKDNQIKHMGYRIELEEIEAASNCLDYIIEACSIHGKIKGISKIILFIASRKKINDQSLKQDLKKYLPDYMIPSKIVYFAELPKNQNGKIDRNKLYHQFFG